MATDDRPRITGIGGVFFKSDDPAAMRRWYGEHFGLNTNDYGATFEFREADAPDTKAYLQWSPFAADTAYFAPSAKPFMINYRVRHLEALLEQLRAAGVTVLDEIAHEPYGKFVHVLDPEGNKIELWEPVDAGLDEPGSGDAEG